MKHVLLICAHVLATLAALLGSVVAIFFLRAGSCSGSPSRQFVRDHVVPGVSYRYLPRVLQYVACVYIMLLVLFWPFFFVPLVVGQGFCAANDDGMFGK